MFNINNVLAFVFGFYVGMFVMPEPHFTMINDNQAHASSVVSPDILNPPYTVGEYHDFSEICKDDTYYPYVLDYIDQDDHILALTFLDTLDAIGVCDFKYPDSASMYINGVRDYGLTGNFYYIVYELKNSPDDEAIYYTMVINPFESNDI